MNAFQLKRKYKEGQRDFAKSKLSKAKLRNTDLRGVNLQEADLSGADLFGVNLTEANLRGANLTGVNFCQSNLCGADLSRTNLYGANLKKANLHRAYLYQANLSNANLEEAYLRGVDLSNVISNHNTKWPTELNDATGLRFIDKSADNREGLIQSDYEPRDGSKYLGHYRRYHGQFGSHPLHDNYTDEGDAE